MHLFFEDIAFPSAALAPSAAIQLLKGEGAMPLRNTILMRAQEEGGVFGNRKPFESGWDGEGGKRTKDIHEALRGGQPEGM